MVDAAVGGSSVLGIGVESSLGIRGGSLYSFRFNKAAFGREDKENPATEITGAGGQGQGTPGAVEFSGSLDFDLTVSRLAFMLAAMYGAPDVTALKAAASVTVGGSGTGYTNGAAAVFSGGGATVQATGHAVVSAGNVTSIVVDTPGSGYTSTPTVAVAGGSGNTFTAVLSATVSWLAKFRPGKRPSQNRSLYAYVDEGGSYSANVQNGRRPSDVSIKEDANKRLVTTATFAAATGDTISGFPIAKSTNAGTFINGSAMLGKSQTRGRRPTVQADGLTADTDWTSGLSLYLKCTASDANTITFKAAYAAASAHTDGTSFATPTYGSTTFIVRRPGSALSSSGYVPVVLSNGNAVGQFLEGNSDKYELTFGDQDLSGVSVNDEFEIPYQLAAGGITPVQTSENKLSAYHLLRLLGGADVRFDTGTMKLSRPFTPYFVNGKKTAETIDPSGDIGAEIGFNRRRFDRAFREKREQSLRFVGEDIMVFDVPINGVVGGAKEGAHFFFPQEKVAGLKTGDIDKKDALDEDVTLQCEQPKANSDNTLKAGAPPSNPVLCAGDTFDNLATYPFQVNLVSLVDLTPIASV